MATPKKCWHYLYVIYYPSRDYRFYYGSRITSSHPDADWNYFGSSVSFAQYNDHTHPEYQADAIKVILSAKRQGRTKKAEKELSHAEAELIRAALQEFGLNLCLNRNVKGRFCLTDDQRQEALRRSIENGGGFVNMTKNQQLKWASVGGLKSYHMRAGVHGIPKERMNEILRRGRQTIADRYSKTYQFTNPAGKVVTIHNLKGFCKNNGLSDCHMRSIKAGRIKSHKGWKNA
jgi:hypothetical protein